MNNRISHILLLSLLSSPSLATGQTDSTRLDTTRTYTAPQIVVEASSIAPRIARSAQPLAIVERAAIEAAGAVDLADAVAFSPGVFVKRYGGLGGLQTIAVRGTSSQQSVLLVDGVRYQSSSSGGFDLGNIPAASIEQVEVLRGGSGAMYGANALGGVINVVMRSAGDGRIRGEIRSTAGSFGERSIGAAIGGGGDHRWDISLQATAATGEYPFAFNEYGVTKRLHRENGDFSNLFARAGFSTGSAPLRLSFSIQGFRSERGVPGAVVQGNREQLHARLDERELFSAARLIYAPSEWTGSLTINGRLNRFDYRDPDARVSGAEGIDDRYDRREVSAVVKTGRLIGTTGSIEAFGEIAYAEMAGDNLDPSVGSFVHRMQASGGMMSNWFIEEALPDIDLSIDAALRFDTFSDLDPAFSPSLGLLVHPVESPFRFRAHGSLNHRAPSFSEQYYLNFGNTELRSERSHSFDIGATYEWSDDLVLESSFFLIDTRDQIVAVPRSPVSWSAMNIGRVLSRGVELSATGKLLDGLLDLHAAYTLMRAEDRSGGTADGKQLVYSPNEVASGIATLHLDRYAISGSWQHVSHRHTLPLNPPESALQGYQLIGATISGAWQVMSLDIMARLEASNLLDVDYQVVRNYPMPGRTFRIGLAVRYDDEE